jgi:hypothetical protein
MPGIRTSISTTSGASRRVSSSASRPSAASPTDGRLAFERHPEPHRSSGWSSASSTVELIADRLDHQARLHLPAAALGRAGVDHPAEYRGALAHPSRPRPPSPAGPPLPSS